MLQSYVHRENRFRIGFVAQLQILKLNSLVVAAAPQPAFAPGTFHEYSPHGFGGGGEEVAAVVPLLVVPAG